jgi:hypothetical protein
VSVEQDKFFKDRGKKAIVLRSHVKWPDGQQTTDHHVLDKDGIRELRNYLNEILEN